MKFQVTPKLEVNLTQRGMHPQGVSDFAIKNRISTIVSPPEMIQALVTHRSIRNGQYRIICTVDFPEGKLFALDKFKTIEEGFELADGYEILLSPNKTQIELKNEMRAIFSFLRQINQFIEIRWCLGGFSRPLDNTQSILDHMSQFPPSYVRIDHHLTLPNLDQDRHQELIEFVNSKVPFPIKTSGNINLALLRSLSKLKNLKRFDVTVDQAIEIVKTLEKEEREQNELAASTPDVG